MQLFYPMELIQQSATIFGVTIPVNRMVRWLNPMASIVDAYRTVIYGVVDYLPNQTTLYYPPASPDAGFLLRTGLTAGIVLLVGWLVFHRLSPYFGEEV